MICNIAAVGDTKPPFRATPADYTKIKCINATQKCVHELAPLSGAHGTENSSGVA